MPANGFSIKPLKVKRLAGEQKSTECLLVLVRLICGLAQGLSGLGHLQRRVGAEDTLMADPCRGFKRTISLLTSPKSMFPPIGISLLVMAQEVPNKGSLPSLSLAVVGWGASL